MPSEVAPQVLAIAFGECVPLATCPGCAEEGLGVEVGKDDEDDFGGQARLGCVLDAWLLAWNHVSLGQKRSSWWPSHWHLEG